MGDCCTPEPTMFSVPGGTPSAGIAKGSPLAGFLGTLSPQKEFPWGSGGRSAPGKNGRAGQRPATGEGRRRRPEWQKLVGSRRPLPKTNNGLGRPFQHPGLNRKRRRLPGEERRLRRRQYRQQTGAGGKKLPRLPQMAQP